MRGATDTKILEQWFLEVSIHAPRAGCDYIARGKRCPFVRFQFTHPVRGATVESLRQELAQYVSIHAPRAGCDGSIALVNLIVLRFNSRTPCGVRPKALELARSYKMFQFTHPVRGATKKADLTNLATKVSIHAPRAGCDTIVDYNPSFSEVSIHAPRAGCDWSVILI